MIQDIKNIPALCISKFMPWIFIPLAFFKEPCEQYQMIYSYVLLVCFERIMFSYYERNTHIEETN